MERAKPIFVTIFNITQIQLKIFSIIKIKIKFPLKYVISIFIVFSPNNFYTPTQIFIVYQLLWLYLFAKIYSNFNFIKYILSDVKLTFAHSKKILTHKLSGKKFDSVFW